MIPFKSFKEFWQRLLLDDRVHKSVVNWSDRRHAVDAAVELIGALPSLGICTKAIRAILASFDKKEPALQQTAIKFKRYDRIRCLMNLRDAIEMRLELHGGSM